METKVLIKYVRMAPRKVRLVLTAIKNKPAYMALSHLRFLNKKGARIVEKVLKSAIASAKEKKMDEDRIFVKEVRADGGPNFKRIMTRSMGRADRIVKRTTHISLVLGELSRPVLNHPKSSAEKPEVKAKKIRAGKKEEKTLKASA
ncbi:MAG: 50S ribosomal protein L22 [Candidatus Omnitrophica bacterium]|nr:50S ribosomal protein L22 [Candidatus Omnitrophota bacterium]